MPFFRNKEIKGFTTALFAISVILVIAGFFISATTGMFVLVACVLLCVVFFFYTKKRYQDLEALSWQIDEILHGKDDLILNNSKKVILQAFELLFILSGNLPKVRHC